MTEVDVSDVGANLDARGAQRDGLGTGKRVSPALVNQNRVKAFLLSQLPELDEFFGRGFGCGRKNNAETRHTFSVVVGAPLCGCPPLGARRAPLQLGGHAGPPLLAFSFSRLGSGLSFVARTHHLLLELHCQCSRTRRIKDHHIFSGHGKLEAARLRPQRQIQQDHQQKEHLPGQQPEKTLDSLQICGTVRSRGPALWMRLFGRHESSFLSLRAFLEQSRLMAVPYIEFLERAYNSITVYTCSSYRL